MNRFTFTINNIDFIAFKFGGCRWAVCFNGFSHGSKTCKYIPGGDELPSETDCYILAENYAKSGAKPIYF